MTEAVLEKIEPEVEDRKFDLGSVVITAAIADLITEEKIPPMFILECLQKHQTGNWGDVCDGDKEINDQACNKDNPQRILSSYKINGIEVWIITEWDRSVTTALLPSDY